MITHVGQGCIFGASHAPHSKGGAQALPNYYMIMPTPVAVERLNSGW